MARCVSVAVPVPRLDALTYRVPEGVPVPSRGARAVVPVGARLMTGIVLGPVVPESESADLRDIADILDDGAFLPESTLTLALWTAEYYACAPGEAIAAAMPPRSTVEVRRVLRVTEAGARLVGQQGIDGLAPLEREALRAIAASRQLPTATLGARLAAATGRRTPPDTTALVERFVRLGLVTADHAAEGGRGPRLERLVQITEDGRRVTHTPNVSRLGPQQRSILAALVGSADGLTPAQLRAQGLSPAGIPGLEARGLVSISSRVVERNPFAGPWGLGGNGGGRGPVTPTPEQAVALERLQALADRDVFAACLLHGVTGSGKTEVYVRLAAHVVARGGNVLVLVPEIGLTPALASAFRATFGDRVAVQHSGLSEGERRDQWHRIRDGRVAVVVGTRSAVFAPVASLRLVVVDEEHDSSYKQDENPRYNGRDLAIVRAKQAGAVVVLGSATPSLESYEHARAGRYLLVELDQRVHARPLAAVRTVDMRQELAERGPDTVVSQALLEAIGTRLERHEQTLLLLNRRGFSTAVFCRQCGGSVECPNCSVSLVVYGRGTAACHYCNHTRRVPKTCPTCGAPYLELMGYGTERVEQEVADSFPAAKVARIDRDAARRRGAVPEILDAFGRGLIDVLVGTQMIAKGHDFPRVTLVGVVSADVGLGLADFRAAERTFQLLTQVVGRAGRGETPGEAVIQTLYPEHYSIRHACRQDYRAFFADEIRFRQAMRYPPRVALINGVVRAPSETDAIREAADLVSRIRKRVQADTIQVIGPAPAPLARLRGEHRAQFFVKAKPTLRTTMREAVQAAVQERPDLQRRVVIDVDPVNIL